MKKPNYDLSSYTPIAIAFVIIMVIGLLFLIPWINMLLWNFVFGTRITTFGYWEMFALTVMLIEVGGMFKK